MWLREQEEIAIGQTDGNEREWNGEYYASYGGNEDRVWEEARQCGFISAGGRPWFSNTLQLLNKGDRVWVNIPGSGYVGVGIVEQECTVSNEFKIINDEESVLLKDTDLKARNLHADEINNENKEFFVGVKWIKTVSEQEAIKEKGFFGNQNSVARPKSAKWDHTIERLKKRFGVIG